MKHLLKVILFILINNNIVIAQFISDKPIMSLPTNLNGELEHKTYLGIFDPSRFNINHSFEMSMITNNGNPYSITGLSNQLAYKASENLQLDATIGLYMSQFSANHMGSLNKINVAYDAGVTYRPTNNSFLKLRIQNFPHSQMYQSYSQPYYRFIQ